MLLIYATVFSLLITCFAFFRPRKETKNHVIPMILGGSLTITWTLDWLSVMQVLVISMCVWAEGFFWFSWLGLKHFLLDGKTFSDMFPSCSSGVNKAASGSVFCWHQKTVFRAISKYWTLYHGNMLIRLWFCSSTPNKMCFPPVKLKLWQNLYWQQQTVRV